MGKLAKYMFLGLLLFATLYFFGDFRVNDIHIRSYLQQHVTVDNILKAKQNCVKVVSALKRGLALVGNEVHKMDNPQRQVVADFKLDTTQDLKAQYDESLDSLTAKDRLEMRSLIEKNVTNTDVAATT